MKNCFTKSFKDEQEFNFNQINSSHDIVFDKKFDISEFKDDAQLFLKDYICFFCHGIIYKAVIDSCGDIFCEDCALNYFRYYDRCPLSNKIVNVDEIQKNFTPINSLIFSKEIYCKNKNKGCVWEGKLSSLSAHLDQDCPRQIIPCKNILCQIQMLRENIQDHSYTCDFRKINCQFCSEEIIYTEYQGHLENCASYCFPCANNCGLMVMRKNFESHIKYECNNSIIEYCFNLLGCEERFARKTLTEHINNFGYKHIQLITKFFVYKEKNSRDELGKELNYLQKNFLEFKENISIEQLKQASIIESQALEIKNLKNDKENYMMIMPEFVKNMKIELAENFKNELMILNSKIQSLSQVMTKKEPIIENLQRQILELHVLMQIVKNRLINFH